MGAALIGDDLERAQNRRRDRIEAIGDARIASVGGIEKLHEIIGADGEEVDAIEQFVELVEQRRHLEHGPDLDLLGQLVAVPAQVGEFALDQRLGLVEFLDGGDHRKHDFQVASARGAQQRADLAAQQARAVETQSYGAPTERRVLLLDIAHVGQHLVAADVEGAERHRLVAGRIEHGAVERELLGRAGEGRRHHELQFGAEQPDAGGAGLLDMRQVDGKTGIDHQLDLLAIPGHACLVAQREILQLPAGAQPHSLDISRLHVRRWPHVHVAGRAIDDDGVARVGNAGGIGDLADRRDAERTGDDRHVRIGPAFFENEAAQPFAIVFEQRRRSHGAGNQDGVFRQAVARRRVVLAEQMMHQPIGEFVQVMQALAQIWIGRAQHARAGVRLHALDRGLGGEARRHRFFETMHPTAVVGEHAIGFEHVAVLAAIGDLAALEQHVEVRPHGLDRGFQAFQLFRQVVGDEIGDDDARLVQHHVTERDALVERHAGKMQRTPRGGFGAGLGDGGEFARGDHLREHHRGRL